MGSHDVITAREWQHGWCRQASEQLGQVVELVLGDVQHDVLGLPGVERSLEAQAHRGERVVDIGAPGERCLTRHALFEHPQPIALQASAGLAQVDDRVG